jgi:hypothetical protein
MIVYDVLLALRPVVTALELTGAHFFITGPIATTIHGVGRAPLDIELVSDLAPSGTDILDRLLAPAIVRTGPAMLLHVDTSIPITLRRAQPSPFSAAAFARSQAIILDEASGFASWVASAEDAVLDLLPAVAQNPRSGSQLWYDVMGVVKLQTSALDVGYIANVAARVGLASARQELLAQRDTVPLAWDCRWRPSGAGWHTVAA